MSVTSSMLLLKASSLVLYSWPYFHSTNHVQDRPSLNARVRYELHHHGAASLTESELSVTSCLSTPKLFILIAQMPRLCLCLDTHSWHRVPLPYKTCLFCLQKSAVELYSYTIRFQKACVPSFAPIRTVCSTLSHPASTELTVLFEPKAVIPLRAD